MSLNMGWNLEGFFFKDSFLLPLCICHGWKGRNLGLLVNQKWTSKWNLGCVYRSTVSKTQEVIKPVYVAPVRLQLQFCVQFEAPHYKKERRGPRGECWRWSKGWKPSCMKKGWRNQVCLVWSKGDFWGWGGRGGMSSVFKNLKSCCKEDGETLFFFTAENVVQQV